MARRSGKKRDGSERRPPRLPPDGPVATAEGDRLFQEAMANLGKVPVKDRDTVPPVSSQGGGGGKGAREAPVQIDLHRLSLADAKARVDAVLGGHLMRLRAGAGQATLTFQVITGKGLHSGTGGPVLAREIHAYVRQRYAAVIVSIEDSPADVVVGDVPIRGHFHVTLGTKIR